ncbi:MAG: creatininase family protein, partial [Chitinivibrionales bacterium]|nr:creatininase family protein [Chitinivibrionales bacterium]
PQQFRERLAAAPIAYLPLGTLEWHGEHMPLGADGLQSKGFFERLARDVGGIVLPMLFVGPDRRTERDGCEFYGMDIPHLGGQAGYDMQQLPGSAYWVPDEVFGQLLHAILSQLKRAGFRVVVAHGHGPSTCYFRDHIDTYRQELGLELFHCWGADNKREDLGIQVDHGAANETSLVMALRPELVEMKNLPEDPEVWPLAIGGRDPRTHASPELGRKAIDTQAERMSAILREALRR